MQRKAYVPGIAALLAALLAGCTGGSDDHATSDGSNPEGVGPATATAEPGRYRTLPEPCGAVDAGTLDTLLPGILEIADEVRREQAYEGEATVTYDTDRKVGCRWKVESAAATDHLLIDFERVVSYDSAVSDDSEAEAVFATKVAAADLPEPAPSDSDTDGGTGGDGGTGTDPESVRPSAQSSSSPGAGASASPRSSESPSGTVSATPSGTPTALQPRLLEDLGDEAFVDDELSSSGSTAKRRTVTVAFRTSNVIVTIEYEEQPATVGVVPDSKEMQDRAQKLAFRLADSLSG
ncbi:DUF3558 domain-containing protein [Streptomyces sp. enrichment culture]|uniref:DUF3558 domain-containing protein n=1 Tax=Streptomyces sp. enrichment culture TaxID=1795815 RepID=UPI003F54AEF9